ncbi:MAG: histidine kinase [Bacteroidetes bacterium]|nr:histidine kinase [Bacteroidota bacterium]
MGKRISVILFFILLLRFQESVAQEYVSNIHSFIQYPGLKKVNCILKDSRGITWIGCHGGLFSETANKLTYYTEKTGFPVVPVNNIAEDSKGLIWISANNGLYVYNGVEFYHFSTFRLKGNQQITVYQTRQLKNNELYTCTQDGLFRIKRYSRDSLYHEQIYNRPVYNFIESPDGALVIASDNGLVKLTGQNFMVKYQLNIQLDNQQLRNTKFVKSENNVYFSNNHLFRIAGDSVLLIKLNVHPNFAGPLLCYEKRVYFGDYQMYYYDEISNNIVIYDIGGPANTDLLIEKSPKPTYYLGGFQSYTKFTDINWAFKSDNLNHNDPVIFRKSPFDHGIYMIENAGNYRITLCDGIMNTAYTGKVLKVWNKFDKKGFGEVVDWAFLSNGDFIITTYNSGAYHYIQDKELIQEIQFPEKARFSKRTQRITVESDSIVIIPSDGYFIRYNLFKREYESIQKTNDELIYQTEIFETDILLFTSKGIVLRSKIDPRIERNISQELGIRDLNQISSYFDKKDRLIWVILSSGELIILKYYNSTNINLIFRSFENNLPPFQRIVNRYALDNGIRLFTDIHHAVAFKEASNEILFQVIDSTGNLKELLHLCGRNIVQNGKSYNVCSYNLRFYISDMVVLKELLQLENCKTSLIKVKVNGRNISNPFDRFFSQGKSFTLASNENNLEFYFSSSIDFPLHSTRYAYYLEGLEKEWSHFSDEEAVKYERLLPGEYVLHYKVWGSFNSKEATVRIVISGPWYLSRWFIGILVIAFLGISYILSRFIAKKRLKQAARNLRYAQAEKELARNRLMALRSQIEPHTITNLLQSIQGHMVLKDFRTANKVLGEYGSFMRSIFEQAGKEWVTLSEEINFIRKFVNLQEINGNEVLLQVEDPDNAGMKGLVIPAMMILPVIENIFKYGRSLSEPFVVYIGITVKDRLVIDIIDNGPGKVMNDVDLGRNSGLKVTKERLSYLRELGIEVIMEINPDEIRPTYYSGFWVRFILPVLMLDNNQSQYDIPNYIGG